MRVYRVKSTLVAITQFDEIPFTKLLNSVNTQKLVDRYNLTIAEMGQGNDNRPVLVCQLGTFQHEEDYVIVKLVIEERKIICELEAGKAVIDAFYADLANFLADMSVYEKDELLIPVFVSDESELVVKLDIDASSLLAPQYLRFLETRVVPELNFDSASARIKPSSIQFDVEYITTDPSLQDYRIAVTRKELSLHPRSGYPLEDRVFASKAPVNSKLHIELLEELEKALPS